jgi:hypothetical protein
MNAPQIRVPHVRDGFIVANVGFGTFGNREANVGLGTCGNHEANMGLGTCGNHEYAKT